MPKLNLAQKIIASHLISGEMLPGKEITLSANQALVHDSCSGAIFLHARALGLKRAKVQAVSYSDYYNSRLNNSEELLFISTFCEKYGIYHSLPGNGICHQVHLERFSAPGELLVGADFHATAIGAAATLAFAAGALETAKVLCEGQITLLMPEVLGINLKGRLNAWINAKDAALDIMGRIEMPQASGKILEFYGEGVKSLSVYERATICNMLAETGAATVIFPSDAETKKFFHAQNRDTRWLPLQSDRNSEYSRTFDVDLGQIEPMVAKPHWPANVSKIAEAQGLKVLQICIGSCGNSSVEDLAAAALILKGKKISRNVTLTVTPGSRYALAAASANGSLGELIASGARILECACGPCAGISEAPAAGSISLRSFNRNYPGMSPANAKVFLASPESCAAAALIGEITDPRKLGEPPKIKIPKNIPADDAMIAYPAREEDAEKVEVKYHAKLGQFPETAAPPDSAGVKIILKLPDDFSADQILPPARRLSGFQPGGIPGLFKTVKPGFTLPPAEEKQALLLMAGENYGHGSSRDDFLSFLNNGGIRIIIAKSFGAAHYRNLINWGILPLTFANPEDYARADENDCLQFENLHQKLKESFVIKATNSAKSQSLELRHALTPHQLNIVLSGGLLNLYKKQGGAAA